MSINLKKTIKLVSNFLCLIFCVFNISTVQAGNISQTERDALMALYNTTDGINWSNSTGWMGNGSVNGSECIWHGVTCADLQGITHVIKLVLTDNALFGSIPPEIGNLTALTELSLDTTHNNFFLNNNLTGSIPPEIGNLTALTVLNLASNRLTGSIPPEIGNLTALTFLNIHANHLTGFIPQEIGNLTALTLLFLGSNQLSGSIPTEIGNLTSITGLYLSFNGLTGTIPLSLQNLPNLQGLLIWGNDCLKTLDLTFINFLSNLDNSWINCNSPDNIVFTEQTDVDLGSTNSSNIITISGLISPILISVTNGSITINGIAINPVVNTTISNGDQLKVFQDSSSTGNTTVSTVVTLGEFTRGQISVAFNTTTSTVCFPIKFPNVEYMIICP